jgi:hypothetical protein
LTRIAVSIAAKISAFIVLCDFLASSLTTSRHPSGRRIIKRSADALLYSFIKISLYATVAFKFYATVEVWPQDFFYATVAQNGNLAMTISTNRESDRFMLRLPDGMRDRIKAAAEANNRSMNAEIVATLQEKYPEPTTDDLRVFLEEFRARLDEVRSEADAKALADDVDQRIKEKGR